MRTASDQIALFPDLPPAGVALSAEMERDLAKLEAARPLGLTRSRGGWAAPGHKLPISRGVALVAAQVARVDYSGRHPRLKITAKGRRAIGAYDEERPR